MNDGGYDNLAVSREGSVARVALNRPGSRNALNAALIEDLTRCFEALAEDERARVVVLAGKGRAFCAGADVGYMRDTASFSYEKNLEDARRLAEMFRAVDECPKPVVAEVQGAAIGGGAGLVVAADVVVADRETVFAFSEVRLGIAPATIAPFVVRKIGFSSARALFLTGERFGAEKARELGLVHAASGGEDLESVVGEKVSALLEGGPQAQSAVKLALRRIEAVHPEEAAGIMSRLIAELRTGAEGQEGLTAFLEKRAPYWRQR